MLKCSKRPYQNSHCMWMEFVNGNVSINYIYFSKVKRMIDTNILAPFSLDHSMMKIDNLNRGHGRERVVQLWRGGEKHWSPHIVCFLTSPIPTWTLLILYISHPMKIHWYYKVVFSCSYHDPTLIALNDVVAYWSILVCTCHSIVHMNLCLYWEERHKDFGAFLWLYALSTLDAWWRCTELSSCSRMQYQPLQPHLNISN